MYMTIVMIIFYVVLLSAAFAVGSWLEKNDRAYKAR